MEVERSLLRVVETVFLGKLNEVWRGHEVVVVDGIIDAETTLVACCEVFSLGHFAGQPAVTAGCFEIPYLLTVNKADTESLGNTMFLYQHAQPFHALACSADIGQHNVENGILGYPVLDEWVELQHGVTAENAFGGTHAHTCCVKAGATPVIGQAEWRKGAIAQPFGWQLATEWAVFGHVFARAVLCIFVEFVVLGLHGIPVLRTGYNHGTIACHFLANDYRCTF